MQQAESISQEVGDILDKAERRGIRCITNHTNGINNDVLKVNCGNGDSGYRRLKLCGGKAVSWILSVLVTVAVEMEITDLLC